MFAHAYVVSGWGGGDMKGKGTGKGKGKEGCVCFVLIFHLVTMPDVEVER